ncbi:hypothetical protein H5J25_08855 [Sphingomonas aliaeris]|uniref:Energy transducer TonB n=1 Tax=Sphingomonas aliaeris TaxID=2759526 RepID=A0A974S638_9SPHN|nr:hypothetical protein [Sphingomonas aliaeris]QQV78685.1 hypothetical protein H5J25_08855 [Sphingomonas aliaeris]
MQPTTIAPSADNPASSGYRSASDRRRFAGLAMAIVAHLIVLLIMLRIAPTLPTKEQEPPTTFTLNPVPNPAPTPGPATPKVDKARETDKGSPPKTPPVAPKPLAPTVTPTKPIELPQLIGGKDMFDAVGVATSKPGRDGSGDGQSVAGADSGSAYGPGSGPGGQRLYNAEWYREPTDAELGGYLPPRAQPGWGLIACKTIENYHVENCRALGESPLGSGLARAFRQAAWQFRVRPPRIGGKEQVGAWVSIRITLSDGGQVSAR